MAKEFNELMRMGYDELIKHAELTLRAVKTKAYGEGYAQGKFDAMADEMVGTLPARSVQSPQQLRDAIVERTKADIKSLKDSPPTSKSGWAYSFEAYRCDADFIVNSKKKTVVCLLNWRLNGEIISKGIAKCAPNDCFNVHIGKAIALRRALGLEVPSEYLNAPQPTEVHVGDVVNGAKWASYYKPSKRFTITKIKGKRYDYAEDPSDFIYENQIGKIIDDSREGVTE